MKKTTVSYKEQQKCRRLDEFEEENKEDTESA